MSSPAQNSSDDGSSSASGSISRREQQNAEVTRKKQKVTRSKTACLQCRARRSRCGAVPPEPCVACVQHGLTCTWAPNETGTKRGRPRRKSNRAEAGINVINDGTSTAHLPDTSQQPPMFDTLSPGTFLGTLLRQEPSNHFDYSAQPSITNDWDNLAAMTAAPLYLDPQLSAIPPTIDYLGDSHTNSILPAINQSTIHVNSIHYHGQTGALHGMERNEIHIPINPPTTIPTPLDERGLPDRALIQHVLTLYFNHFGSQFPFLVETDVNQEDPLFPFVFHCMAALVSRFSDHPTLFDPSSRHTSGTSFYEQAKAKLGMLLGIPDRRIIHCLLMLTGSALGRGERSEMWMFLGAAVRLSLHMSLHLNHISCSSNEESRLDRLLFWSVLIYDYTLSFSEGRPTTIPPGDITQDLPGDDDIPADHRIHGEISDDTEAPRSPFRYGAEMMLAFGPLINIFNDQLETRRDKQEDTVQSLRAQIADQYDELPLDMIWNAANLKLHYQARQGPMYLFLHLWNHTIQSTRYLLRPGLALESIGSFGPTGKTARITLQSIQAGSWLHCARFIGDMLVLADVIDSNMYLAIPTVSQSFFMAARCFVEDLKARITAANTPPAESNEETDVTKRKNELSDTLFKAVAVENIKTFKKGLKRQAAYWHGILPVKVALETGLGDILETVNSRMAFKDGQLTRVNPINEPSSTFQGINNNTSPPWAIDDLSLFSGLHAAGVFAAGNDFLNHSDLAESPSDFFRMLGMDNSGL